MPRPPVNRTQGGPPWNAEEQGAPQPKRSWPPKDPPMFWVTLAAFLGVCAYTGVAIKQVSETQNANEISREGTYISNRPYFMFDSFTPIREVDDKGALVRWRIGPNMANYGNSPADTITVYLCDQILVEGAASPNLTCHLSQKAPSNGPLGPKQAWHIIGVPVSTSDYDSTEGGKKWEYLFGYVTYTDGLRPQVAHQTRFCQKLSKGIAPPGLEAMSGTGCGDVKWSCFDAGCIGDPLSPQ